MEGSDICKGSKTSRITGVVDMALKVMERSDGCSYTLSDNIRLHINSVMPLFFMVVFIPCMYSTGVCLIFGMC